MRRLLRLLPAVRRALAGRGLARAAASGATRTRRDVRARRRWTSPAPPGTGPPHPEVVNAATFALRRAVNAYPDDAPLRAAIAASHDIAPVARGGRARRGRADPRRAAGGGDAGGRDRLAGLGPAALAGRRGGRAPVPVGEPSGARARPCSAGPTTRPARSPTSCRAPTLADRRRGAGGLPGRRADPRPPAGDPGPLVLEGPRHGGVPGRLRGVPDGRAGSARRCSASGRRRWRAPCGRSSSGAESARRRREQAARAARAAGGASSTSRRARGRTCGWRAGRRGAGRAAHLRRARDAPGVTTSTSASRCATRPARPAAESRCGVRRRAHPRPPRQETRASPAVDSSARLTRCVLLCVILMLPDRASTNAGPGWEPLAIDFANHRPPARRSTTPSCSPVARICGPGRTRDAPRP